MSNRLQQPANIWITGAGSGIGEAVSRKLISDGHRLVVTGRRQQPLDELGKLAPERVLTAAADTTSTDELKGIAATVEGHGSLNMAILNAGTCEYLDIRNYQSDVIAKNVTTKPRPHSNLGLAWQRRQNPDLDIRMDELTRAEEHFQRALEIQPEFTKALGRSPISRWKSHHRT